MVIFLWDWQGVSQSTFDLEVALPTTTSSLEKQKQNNNNGAAAINSNKTGAENSMKAWTKKNESGVWPIITTYSIAHCVHQSDFIFNN